MNSFLSSFLPSKTLIILKSSEFILFLSCNLKIELTTKWKIHHQYQLKIQKKDGETFVMSFHSFIEHILLLRQVIQHAEMRIKGTSLDSFIKTYCMKMSQSEMNSADQQSKLPREIEWIWHVHRLHPLKYLNDCNKQLSTGLVDKKMLKLFQ
jgi:hypothetical protein